MRVERTFCFLDLCGFTAFTDAYGDAEAVAVLSHMRAIVRAGAEKHGVRVTKWLGDGVMLSGVDATKVVACATTVARRLRLEGKLELRGGVCRGGVIMFEGDDYIGAAVNVAARLCRIAKPGQLLAADSVVAYLTPDTGAVPLGHRAIDGLAAPVEIHAIAVTDAGVAGSRGAPPRVASAATVRGLAC